MFRIRKLFLALMVLLIIGYAATPSANAEPLVVISTGATVNTSFATGFDFDPVPDSTGGPSLRVSSSNVMINSLTADEKALLDA